MCYNKIQGKMHHMLNWIKNPKTVLDRIPGKASKEEKYCEWKQCDYGMWIRQQPVLETVSENATNQQARIWARYRLDEGNDYS